MASASRTPFSMGILITDIDFELDDRGTRGKLTLEAYNRASAGNFGRVLFGWYRGTRIALKILPSKPDVPADEAHAIFIAEAENMLAVRSVIDRAQVLLRVGAPLSEPCDLPDAGRRCRELHDLRGWRHLVYVHGVGSVPDLVAIAPGLPPGPAHFVIMEPLTGGSLKGLPRPADVVARAPSELSSGLAALASAHVVHADLKPENIMLRAPGGELVLTDFGVGRIARGGVDEVSYYGNALGTVVYMAPELLDERHASTFASDVFALGMVLWCLFSERTHPWADASGRLPGAGPLIARVLRGERPDLAALAADAPPGLRALIERCWASDAAARPTAAAVALETAGWQQAPAPWDAVIRRLEGEIRRLRDTANAAAEEATRREEAAVAAAVEEATRREKAAAAAAVEEATRRERAAAAAAIETERAKAAALQAELDALRRPREIPVAPPATPEPEFAPHGLTAAQAAQLQAWVGGSGSPSAWAEVYRGSRDGFTAASFHGRCDDKARLLILVRDKEAGWLFGGFTALGFIEGDNRWYADPAAFLFSLTNPAGRPERLASKGDGHGVYYGLDRLVHLGSGWDLCIADGCASNKDSHTAPGTSYAAPSVAGSHPMAQGRVNFTVAELVAWTVPQ